MNRAVVPGRRIAGTAVRWEPEVVTGEGPAAESTTGGLITQRMAVERGRAAPIYFIVMGCFFLYQAGVRGFNLVEAVATGAPTDAFHWLLAIGSIPIAIGFFAYGVLKFRSRRKRIAAFNAEHGVDAGRQPLSGR